MLWLLENAKYFTTTRKNNIIVYGGPTLYDRRPRGGRY